MKPPDVAEDAAINAVCTFNNFQVAPGFVVFANIANVAEASRRF